MEPDPAPDVPEEAAPTVEATETETTEATPMEEPAVTPMRRRRRAGRRGGAMRTPEHFDDPGF